MAVTDITFNTGRLYTTEGQVVRAQHNAEHECVFFADFSRCIFGKIKAPAAEIAEFKTPGDLAKFTMGRYDMHDYAMTIVMFARDANAEVHQIRL